MGKEEFVTVVVLHPESLRWLAYRAGTPGTHGLRQSTVLLVTLAEGAPGLA